MKKLCDFKKIEALNMNKKIRGKLLMLLSAVVLCTGCNSGKNRPEDVTVVTGSEENIVYQPSFVQLFL